MKQRLGRIDFDVNGVLDRQRFDDALVGCLAVVDDENAAVAAGFGYRVALRRLDADFLRGERAHAQFVGHHLEPRQRTHARH